MNSLRAYANSKLANLMYSTSLARRLPQSGCHNVTVNAVHPGCVHSVLDRNAFIFLRYSHKLASTLMAKNPREGAQTSVRVAVDPALNGVSGKYFDNCVEAHPGNPMAHNQEAQDRMWEECVRLTST